MDAKIRQQLGDLKQTLFRFWGNLHGQIHLIDRTVRKKGPV